MNELIGRVRRLNVGVIIVAVLSTVALSTIAAFFKGNDSATIVLGFLFWLYAIDIVRHGRARIREVRLNQSNEIEPIEYCRFVLAREMEMIARSVPKLIIAAGVLVPLTVLMGYLAGDWRSFVAFGAVYGGLLLATAAFQRFSELAWRRRALARLATG
ncbi:MAG TPA: hypothetical protein VJ891_01540 [Casimicrobiaceae bacterium]|nr:hypothetical protein [Casimicrobiaceae bacterium]